MDDRMEPLEFAPASERFELLGEESRTSQTLLLRARDLATGRDVGLRRLLSRDDEDPEAERRMETALRAASRLDHPNILPVRQVARDFLGAYCVTDWPARGSLADSRNRRRHSDAEILHVARAVCRALVQAHEQGVFHGDVRPESIYVAEDGAIQLGGFTGGSSSVLDASVDIDALGRTLVELVTGVRPGTITLERLAPWLAELVARSVSGGGGSSGFSSVREMLAVVERRLGETSRADRSSVTVAPTSRGVSPVATGTGTSGPAASEVATILPEGGSEVSEYEFPWKALGDLCELLGQPRKGGMGLVYEARERATGRRIAIKRLRGESAEDRAAIRRFHREAARIADLSHPFILPLYQPARDEEGEYLVMEWAAQGSLQDRLERRGPLSLREVLNVAHKIGSALHYAHGKRIIHRDVKPANILLTESNEPKLADFGLARSYGDGTVTVTKSVGGTPAYAAPEQWSTTRDVDERSDLYAFAKTLYHLSTGEDPSVPDLSRLPTPLRAPIARCLADHPDQRYGSVEEFLFAIKAELRAARGGAPASAISPAAAGSGRRWVPLVGVGVLAAALAIGLGMHFGEGGSTAAPRWIELDRSAGSLDSRWGGVHAEAAEIGSWAAGLASGTAEEPAAGEALDLLRTRAARWSDRLDRELTSAGVADALDRAGIAREANDEEVFRATLEDAEARLEALEEEIASLPEALYHTPVLDAALAQLDERRSLACAEAYVARPPPGGLPASARTRLAAGVYAFMAAPAGEVVPERKHGLSPRTLRLLRALRGLPAAEIDGLERELSSAVAEVERLRERLGALDREEPLRASVDDDLARFAEYVEGASADLDRWRTKVARVRSLQGSLERLHARRRPSVVEMEREVGRLKKEIGEDAPSVLHWREIVRSLKERIPDEDDKAIVVDRSGVEAVLKALTVAEGRPALESAIRAAEQFQASDDPLAADPALVAALAAARESLGRLPARDDGDDPVSEALRDILLAFEHGDDLERVRSRLGFYLKGQRGAPDCVVAQLHRGLVEKQRAIEARGPGDKMMKDAIFEFKAASEFDDDRRYGGESCQARALYEIIVCHDWLVKYWSAANARNADVAGPALWAKNNAQAMKDAGRELEARFPDEKAASGERFVDLAKRL